jgi:hypothetical protein
MSVKASRRPPGIGFLEQPVFRFILSTFRAALPKAMFFRSPGHFEIIVRGGQDKT